MDPFADRRHPRRSWSIVLPSVLGRIEHDGLRGGVRRGIELPTLAEEVRLAAATSYARLDDFYDATRHLSLLGSHASGIHTCLIQLEACDQQEETRGRAWSELTIGAVGL